jgi:hypothetical protein
MQIGKTRRYGKKRGDMATSVFFNLLRYGGKRGDMTASRFKISDFDFPAARMWCAKMNAREKDSGFGWKIGGF